MAEQTQQEVVFLSSLHGYQSTVLFLTNLLGDGMGEPILWQVAPGVGAALPQAAVLHRC